MNWRRALIGAAVVLPLVLLLKIGMGLDPREIPSSLVGQEAPDFGLAVLPLNPSAGARPDTIRLADHVGDVVVLNFWASWCLPCRQEHGPLSRTAAAYGDRDVHFYGTLHRDSPESGRRWIEEMGGQYYPALRDPGSRVAIDYGLRGVPETFFIGRDGKVAYRHLGPVTEEILETQIDALLAATPLDLEIDVRPGT